MGIRMIATDLDGTFLRRDESLPEASIELLRRCRERGVLFVVATARSAASAKAITDVLKPDAVISSGGAEAVCGDAVIYEALFSAEDAEKLIKTCVNDKEIDYIRVAGEEHDFTSNPKIPFGETEYGHYIRTDFQIIPRQKVSKITVASSNIGHVQTLFKAQGQCALIPSYSGKNLHKLSHAKATKEDAMSAVAAHFGLTLREIIAFGDDTSDVNMLSRCGIGIAVHNAGEHVKALADDICDSNDRQGVLRYLEEHFDSLFGGCE